MPLIPSLDNWKNRQVNLFFDVANYMYLWLQSLGKKATRHYVSPPQGLHGDTVLVAGVNTGTAKVEVKLVDKLWKVKRFHFIL